MSDVGQSRGFFKIFKWAELAGIKEIKSPEKRIEDLETEVRVLVGQYQKREELRANGDRRKKDRSEDLEKLQQASPEDQGKKIDALEEKVLILSNAYKAWTERKTDRAAIIELEQKVAMLEKKMEPELTINLSLTNLSTVIFLLAIAVSLWFVACEGGQPAPMYDCAAYVFPVLAGSVAGLSLYTKRAIVPAFRMTLALLALGLASYLLSKQEDVAIAIGIALIGLSPLVVATLWAVSPNPNETVTDKRLGPVRWIIVGITFSLTVAFLILLIRHNPNWLTFLWFRARPTN